MTIFVSYLKEKYKDLAERREMEKKGNKIAFYDYIK